jgi:hypothetical protein
LLRLYFNKNLGIERLPAGRKKGPALEKRRETTLFPGFSLDSRAEADTLVRRY